MNAPTSRRVRAQLIAVCASVVVVIFTAPVVQGVYSDPAYQLKAVQQRLSGESPSVQIRVVPASNDLSKDQRDWIMWWTPGTQLTVYPLMLAGLPMGTAVRVVVAVMLVAGSIGWATWFSFFSLPDVMLFALSAFFPWMRYASNGLFLYSSEALVFGAGPWLLVAAAVFVGQNGDVTRGYVRHFLLGLALGAAYWLKDSMGFVAAGVMVAVAIAAWRDASGRRVVRLARCGVLAAGAAIPFLTLLVMNRMHGGASSKITASLWFRPPGLRTALDALALPALQMSDAFALWDYLLMHPAHPLIQDAIWISAIGAPGGVVLWWLFRRSKVEGSAASIARCVLVCSLSIIVTIWTFSEGVNHHPRHIATAAFGALPLMVAEARMRWRSLTGIARTVLAAAAVAYLCVPLTYGVVSVWAKVHRFPSDYRAGPSGIYDPLLSETDVAAVRESLLQDVTPDQIWYLSDPLSALDLPGRAIASTADFATLDDLKGERYVTSKPVRVHALLPPKFNGDGKGDVIRASFPQAGPWTSTPIRGSSFWLWTADLAAVGTQP